MQLLDIRNSVLSRIGQDHELSASQIDAFINEGYNIVVSHIADTFEDYFGDSETITTVAGTSEYLPTSEFLSVRKVEVLEDGTWYRAGTATLNAIPNQSETTTDTYSPTRPMYYFWGKSIGIIPTPTASTTSFKVWGIVTPTPLSANTDTPQFISSHHWLLSTWALACVLEAVQENYRDAEVVRRRFYDGLDQMVNLIKDRNGDTNRSVRLDSYSGFELY